jgi:alginate O-acetyltransferase complex protein AlgI
MPRGGAPMVFSSPYFLFLFFPLALGLCLAVPRRAYLAAVFFVSVAFYFWSAGRDTAFLLALILGNFLAAKHMRRAAPRWQFGALICLNLAILAWFKYATFFASNLDLLLGSQLRERLGDIALPAGVSFFVFQAISYVVDVRRGELEAEPSLVTYGAYQSFFPHLIAGPIVRYRDIIADLRAPRISVAGLSLGATRFVHGLAKKVLIADGVAPIANAVFDLQGQAISPAGAWLGACAYALQIYFDFSGYSDMAIGLAQLFGVRFHENFERPYGSLSVTDFWRRWHISLSSWFRDYVYIPLGGSRGGALQTYRNLLIVFGLTGMWHGAAWSFLAGGFFHGAFLVGERLVFREPIKAMRHVALRWVYCLPVVIFGWVLFRAPTLARALALWGRMVSVDELAGPLAEDVRTAITPYSLLALAAGGLIFLLPGRMSLGQTLGRETASRTMRGLELGYLTLALLACGLLMLTGSFSPFLYFSF